MGGIRDVPEVHAASIFRVEVRRIGKCSSILSHVLVTIKGVLDWMIEYIDTLYNQLRITGNTAPLLIYTL
jgi:hypothetical protein